MRDTTRRLWRQAWRYLARDPQATGEAEHDPRKHPHYFSTACQHARHRDCRQVCKFCPAECRCACHEEADT